MNLLKKYKMMIVNSAFIIFCGGILIFLYNAPEETTPFLPHDTDHNRFHTIASKKEAEKFCAECHDPDKVAPLPEGHPPKYRCLFCHKRE